MSRATKEKRPDVIEFSCRRCEFQVPFLDALLSHLAAEHGWGVHDGANLQATSVMHMDAREYSETLWEYASGGVPAFGTRRRSYRRTPADVPA